MNRFTIDPVTGVVTTLVVLDREDPTGNVVYGIVIQAEDQSTEASRLSGNRSARQLRISAVCTHTLEPVRLFDQSMTHLLSCYHDQSTDVSRLTD